MKKLSNCNVRRNKKLLISDIVKYYETRGYSLINANAYGMTLEKGSNWGSFTSPNPLKWKTKVKLNVTKLEPMNYTLSAEYKFNTLCQFLSSKTKLYFFKEVEAFSEAMLSFKVNIDEINEIGNEAGVQNTKNMLWALLISIPIAILLIFLLNIYFPHNFSAFTSTIITLLSIIFFNYILAQSNKI